MKGFKAFDKNLKCRDFQYEIGQTYEIDGEIECCKRGFHFCKDLADCYRFYKMTDDTRICEVEAIGKIKTEDDIKYCTNKIKILSEVENPRLKSNVNTSLLGYCNIGAGNSGNMNCGDYNSGHYNTGNRNIGDRNSGYANIGDCNTGDYNSGNHNTGCWNSGGSNVGDFNTGCWNSGSYNSGNMNSGYWNNGNYNSGVFNCEKEPKIKMFDKESDLTMRDWKDSLAYFVMLNCPCYKGYYDKDQEEPLVRETTAKDRQKWWNELSEDDKNAVKSLPNFDADKFYLCTGIRV